LLGFVIGVFFLFKRYPRTAAKVIMNIGRIITAENSGAEVGLAVWVELGVDVGCVDEPGLVLVLGEGVEEIAVKVATMVALLQTTLVPTVSEVLTRTLPPAIPIWEVPVPVTTKVKVARTPEEAADVLATAKTSDNPP
jgi:hypothetical protein